MERPILGNITQHHLIDSVWLFSETGLGMPKKPEGDSALTQVASIFSASNVRNAGVTGNLRTRLRGMAAVLHQTVAWLTRNESECTVERRLL